MTNSDYCNAVSPHGFGCTRPEGHGGVYHIAHTDEIRDGRRVVVDRWRIDDQTTTEVRISRRVIGHLEGSDAWQSGQRAVDSGYERQSTVDMTEAIKTARPRKDGSVTVRLNAEQRTTLHRMAYVMAVGAAENIGAYDEALADLNAARALMRQLNKKDN